MDALLEPIARSPRLPAYLAELQKLAREEQARRETFYAETTPEHKWEFINGEVIMHSPATAKHIEIRERLGVLLGVYVASQALGWSGGGKAMVCCSRNDYEPDILFFGAAKAAGITPDMLRFPPPDFAVEILSASTEHRDRGVKFVDYAAHGVAEYWIVDPLTETIEQYLLPESDEYRLAAKQADGTIHARAVPGFVLPVRAAFDDRENLAALWAMRPANP